MMRPFPTRMLAPVLLAAAAMLACTPPPVDADAGPDPTDGGGNPNTDAGPPDPTATDEIAYQAALALFNAGQYADARTALAAFLVDFPTSARVDNAEYLIARSYFEEADYGTAKTEFTAFINAHPNSILLDDATFYLGRSEQELGNLQVAATVFDTLVSSDPTSPRVDDASYYAGRAYFDLGNFNTAVARFAVVIQDTASSYRDGALLYAGRSEIGLGDLAADPTSSHYTTADTRFETLFADHAGSPFVDAARYYYGHAALGSARWSVAVTRFAYVKDTLTTSAYHDNAWLYLGYAYYRNYDYPPAISELASFNAVGANSTGPLGDSGLYYLARSHHEYGATLTATPATALTEYDTALTMFASVPTTYPASQYVDNAFYFSGRAHYQRASVAQSPDADWAEALTILQAVIDDTNTNLWKDNAYKWRVYTFVDQSDCSSATNELSAFASAFGATNTLYQEASAYASGNGC